MKVVNAYTLEVDDPSVAVDEILEQLDLDNQLLSHSVGFITCGHDYVDTGMVKAICAALPFEVVGCTTLTNANCREAGTMLLCLTVLTADDCRFVTAASPPLGDDPAEAAKTIGRTCREAVSRLGESPALTLAFLPMITNVSGELMLGAFNEAVEGAPVFGTLACDADTTTYKNSSILYHGESSRQGLSLIMVGGRVEPRFVVASISEQNTHKQYAVITASEGNLLKAVNGLSTRDYLYSIGLFQGVGLEAASSLPFIVNYNDGSQPVARALYSLNDDGSASCGGVMPEGGTLAIGQMDLDDILLTAEQSVEKLMGKEKPNGLILFSCLGRNMALGLTPLVEIEKIQSLLGDSIPWHLAYSGGEICPVYVSGGGAVNRFHNFTFVGCAL